MSDEAKEGEEFTLEADSELRFEIEDKDAKVFVTVGSIKL